MKIKLPEFKQGAWIIFSVPPVLGVFYALLLNFDVKFGILSGGFCSFAMLVLAFLYSNRKEVKK